MFHLMTLIICIIGIAAFRTAQSSIKPHGCNRWSVAFDPRNGHDRGGEVLIGGMPVRLRWPYRLSVFLQFRTITPKRISAPCPHRSEIVRLVKGGDLEAFGFLLFS